MRKVISILLIVLTITCPLAYAEEDTIIERFDIALAEAGFTYEKIEPFYQLIGAIAGMKYRIDEDTVVELYAYDIEGEAYQQLVETGMTIMNMPVVINKDTALYMQEEELREIMVDIFVAL